MPGRPIVVTATIHTSFHRQHGRHYREATPPAVRIHNRLNPTMMGDQMYFLPSTPTASPHASTASLVPQQPPRDDIVIRFFSWIGRFFGGA